VADVGHIDFLERARREGTYLVVGIYDDSTVNGIKGANYPIQSLYERVLSVLSCKYVDEVVMAAPYQITEDMIKSLRISAVVHGTVHDGTVAPNIDPYVVPKRLGIYRELQSPRSLATSDIIKRILLNRSRYEERNRKKEAKELAALESLQIGK